MSSIGLVDLLSSFGVSTLLLLKVQVAFCSFYVDSLESSQSNLLSFLYSSYRLFLKLIGLPSFFLPLASNELVEGCWYVFFFSRKELLEKFNGLPLEDARVELAASLSRQVEGVYDFMKYFPISSYFVAVSCNALLLLLPLLVSSEVSTPKICASPIFYSS